MAKAAINRLQATETALADATRQLADLEAARNKALLKDDDEAADKLLAKIEQQRRLVRGCQDKIALLKAEAEREENERRVREKEGLIKRIEAKLAQRDAAAVELADAITKLDAVFRRL